MINRTLLRFTSALAFAASGLVAYDATACEPCMAQAQKYRASAAAEAKFAQQLSGGTGTAVAVPGGNRGPSVSDGARQKAAIYNQMAANLENLYRACKAGQPNECSGNKPAQSGGSSSPGGATPGGPAGGTSASPPNALDQSRALLQSLSSSQGAAFDRNLAALRQLNDAMTRAYQGSVGAGTSAAARSVGNVSLEDDDANDPYGVPGARYKSMPKREAPAPAAPTPPVVVPYNGPPVQEITFDKPGTQPPPGLDTSALNKLVPLGEPPPSPQEKLIANILASANAPPDKPPSQVLGDSVQDDGSGTKKGFGPYPNIEKKLDEIGKGAPSKVGEAYMEEAAPGGLKAIKDEVVDPFNRAQKALKNDGEGVEAAAKEMSNLATNEQVKKDLGNMGTTGGGAMDTLDRSWGSRTGDLSSREEHLQKVGSGDPDMIAYLPTPVQKVLELRDKGYQELGNAEKTMNGVIAKGKEYWGLAKDGVQLARDVRREVKGAVRQGAGWAYEQVQGIFGYGSGQ